MFKFFKKKKQEPPRLSDKEREFITIVIDSLSESHPVFKKELELDTFAYVAPNRIGGEGSFVFGIYNDAWKKIRDTTKANYDIKNIQFKNYDGARVEVVLYISEGLIIGFGTTCPLINIDLSTIDTRYIWEEQFLNKDFSEIELLLKDVSKEQQKRFNILQNTFKITLNQNVYYPLHDIGNGDYIAIDKSGTVYKLTHDPFGATKIHDSIFDLLKEDF